MKSKLLLTFVFAIMSLAQLRAQATNDSTAIAERNQLVESYNSMKSAITAPDLMTLQAQVQKLEELIQKDNALLDTLMARSRMLQSTSDSLAALQKKLNSANAEENFLTDLLVDFGLYICIGAAAVILILVIILIAAAGGKGKLRKSLNAARDLAEETENRFREELSAADSSLKDKIMELKKAHEEKRQSETRMAEIKVASDTAVAKAEEQVRVLQAQLQELKNSKEAVFTEKLAADQKITELLKREQLLGDEKKQLEAALAGQKTETGIGTELIGQYERRIADAEQRRQQAMETIDRLQKEVAVIMDDMKEKNELLEDYRSRATFNEDMNRQIDELEIKVMKLEKLSKLSAGGIITPEEYQENKQKILSSL